MMMTFSTNTQYYKSSHVRVDNTSYVESTYVCDSCNRVDLTLRLVVDHSFESMTTEQEIKSSAPVSVPIVYEYEPVELANIWVHVDITEPENTTPIRLSFHCHKSCLAVSCKLFAAAFKDDPEVKEIILPDTFYRYKNASPYFYGRRPLANETRVRHSTTALEDQIRIVFDSIHYKNIKCDSDPYKPSIGGCMYIMYMAFYLDCAYIGDLLTARINLLCNDLDAIDSDRWTGIDAGAGRFFYLMDIASTIKRPDLSKRFAVLAAKRMLIVQNPYQYIYFTNADDEVRFATAQRSFKR